MVEEFGLFIGGHWTIPEHAHRFHTRSPSTGEELGHFVAATAADVGRAVTAAREALPAWRALPAPRRGEILLAAARIFRERKEALGRRVTQEMGKVIAEGLGDVQEAIDFVEYMAGEGRRMAGETVPSELPGKFCM
ncbi:Aldehyde dehydrogenase domain protein, partial [mine drainage metagenome]